MKNILRSLVLIAIVISISSCAGPFTDKDNGTTVNLSIDDPFEIELKGNASTGFTWKIMPYDSTVIKQVGEPEFKSEDGGRIGSGGLITFKFQTIADGQTDLMLVYKRNWEEQQLHAKTFKIKIVVGTMGRILEE